MFPLRHYLAAAGLAMTVAHASPVQAYQIDCAILLCLGGGFPANAVCSRAKAEMIRRVTPWPIEPPLQIWRCPMRAAHTDPARHANLERLVTVSAPLSPGISLSEPPVPFTNQLRFTADGEYSAENGTADVDIRAPAYDFVRSIRVFSIEVARQQWSDGDSEHCRQFERVQLGTYSAQGGFAWNTSSVSALPTAFKGTEHWLDPEDLGRKYCPRIAHRSVFIDWQDHAGRYGFEQVSY